MKSINKFIKEKLIINKDIVKKYDINFKWQNFTDKEKYEFCNNNDLPDEYVKKLSEMDLKDKIKRKRQIPGIQNSKWYAILIYLYFDKDNLHTKNEIKEFLFPYSSSQHAELFSGLLKTKMLIIEKNKYYKFNEDTTLWNIQDLYYSPF